jgi:hypothetical protein
LSYLQPKANCLSISAFQNLKFLIIVNPNSGPGAAPWWPNEDYTREIPRLNEYANVEVLGYVHATYCQRSVENVLRDIKTYGDRHKDEPLNGLQIQGIFVDETVNLYSPKVAQYLGRIDEEIKANDGIGGDRIVRRNSQDFGVCMLIRTQTIHNPGTSVNKELASPGPDITVVVETSYGQFDTEEYQEWLATSPYSRSRTCYMLHSVPEEEIRDLTVALRDRAEYLFITSAKENFYGRFCNPSWREFVAAMASE